MKEKEKVALVVFRTCIKLFSVKNSVNVPLNAIGLTDSDYLAIFELIVQPVIDDYMPDFLFVSCGFDAAFGRFQVNFK